MLTRPALWLLCLSLAVTRLLGLHLHACAGLEPVPPLAGLHAPSHLADAGLLFGEDHADDHADGVEIGQSAALSGNLAQLGAELLLPGVAWVSLPLTRAGWLSVRAPRGPPPVSFYRLPLSLPPPLRGPPLLARS